MAYPNEREFEIDFIEKTQLLIRGGHKKYSFTLLTNCLYGLVILTYDRIRKKNIPYYQQTIDLIPELHSVRAKPIFIFEPVRGANRTPEIKSLENFIGRMRHSLAHPIIHVENGLNEDNKPIWATIELECVCQSGRNPRPVEFRVSFTETELKTLALKISTAYQEHILGI